MNYKIINKRKFMKKLDIILKECDAFDHHPQTTRLALRANIRMRLVK